MRLQNIKGEFELSTEEQSLANICKELRGGAEAPEVAFCLRCHTRDNREGICVSCGKDTFLVEYSKSVEDFVADQIRGGGIIIRIKGALRENSDAKKDQTGMT